MRDTTSIASCYHCGLPVADPSRWTVLIKNKIEPMCCPGCQTVAGVIVAGGLENYYQFRTELASQANTRFADNKNYGLVYDDPVLQQAFVKKCDEVSGVQLNEVQLYIEDIHCAACCWLIEQALRRKKGVQLISVSLATHKAFLRWDEKTHKLSELLQSIHDVGYQALPFQPEALEKIIAKENRQQLLRLGVAGIGMMQAMMFAIALYSGDFSGIDATYKQFMRWFSLIITLPVIFYSATPFFKSAWRSVKSLQAGMDVPISLALLIAFVASVHSVLFQRGEVYFDSISMFVFFLLLARYAESRARVHGMDARYSSLLPLSCQCAVDDSRPNIFSTIAVEKVQSGHLIRVKAGETIPLDAVVVEGESEVNEVAFSGEQKPVTKKTGSEVFAGTINGDGVLTLRVTSTRGHTRLDIISRLSEWSLSHKPRMSVLADRLATHFTLFVLLLASVAGLYWYAQGSEKTFAIVLSILVVSCPCALSLATPSALACCYHALRQRGLLVSSGNMIEQCRDISHVIFDKTGTLTQGDFSIVRVQTFAALDESLCLELASALEKYSEHPIASAFKNTATDMVLSDVKIRSGQGIEAVWNGEVVRIGSLAFCEELVNSPAPAIKQEGVSVYLAKDHQWLACFYLHDEIRADAKSLVEQLQHAGKQVEILSGDSSGAAEQLSQQLGVSVCHGAMSPEAKLAHINVLQEQGHRVMMVGDGINDIPVLAKAHVSIAMSQASDLAKVKADAILLSDKLLPIGDLFRHCEKTRQIIFQNIIWALLYNGLALPMAAMGWVAPWQAAMGMSVSSLLVTFNSLRLRHVVSINR